MAVIRGSVPADNFTIISNKWLRDERLSWKAKGLLAYITSHRAGYALSVEQILAQGSDGRDAVRAGLRELEEAGYLTRTQRRGDGGRIVSTDYLVGTPVVGKPAGGSDQPECNESPGQPSDGFSTDGEPASKKTTPEKTKKTTSSPSARRGTRVPEDFLPDESMRSWYIANIGASVDGLAEHDRFMDYWRAQPGQRGVKTDWPATWRNWMRSASERSGTRRNTAGRTGGFPTAAERSAAALDREAEIARVAEAVVESRGGNPESFTEVSPVMAKLKADPPLLEALLPVLAVPVAEQADLLKRLLGGLLGDRDPNGSASRTSDLYSDGNGYINGQVKEPREVTDHASE
jgi:hypothetical protein